jgi:hypothetical protein
MHRLKVFLCDGISHASPGRSSVAYEIVETIVRWFFFDQPIQVEILSYTPPMTPDTTRALLRHLVATLAYRAAKVLREAPPGFAEFSSGPNTRPPVQILAHLGDLMTWAGRMVQGEYVWSADGSQDWNRELRRFFDGLGALDKLLTPELPLEQRTAELLIQGPLADALTHVGQLALLRGAAGAPVRPESYARADIVAGRVGLEQSAPGREFDGDASARKA